ncbi:MAG: prolyl oligopeptidase family serine peptidase, partial [Gammaproteobacteria bacterium]|nr:prolyl oligopeptidase family serine peptidase [Gammaproteobacteria bacterium]
MRYLIFHIVVWSALFLVTAGSSADLLPLESFAIPPQFNSVTLSPDGRYLGVKAYRDDRFYAVIYDLDNIESTKPLVIATDPWSVVDLKWANSERILITVEHSVQNFRWNLYANQLTAFDADGSNALVFMSTGKKASPRFDVFLGDNIVDMLPDDPNHVLISWNPDDFKKQRLYKLNIYTSKLTLVQSGKRGTQSWLVDREGKARIGTGIDGNKFKAFQRPVNSKRWQLLFNVPLEDRRLFKPVLIDAEDPDIAYVLSDFEANTIGLYKYRLSSASFVEEIFRHPDFDVSNVTFDRNNKKIQGVSFVRSNLETKWLDPTEPALLAKIRDRLPEYGLLIIDKSEDYKRIVIYASASDRPARYYLYEQEQDQLRFFAHTYPELDGKPLSTVQEVTYQARDDLEIAAFVSVPVGESYPPSAPLPTVILPHGGPAARDFAGFDPLVQFLTNRGYLVLQVNFRGSSGYGRKFRMAGERQWGQAMQDDITDGTQWLVDQGMADPDRICIVGGSYGGYAALMGAVKTPDLFQCAVSINGVSDMQAMMTSNNRFYFGWVANSYIGDWSDRAMLKENSPTNRAADIRIPVLLAHSTKDSVVKFSQSEKMAKALKKAGKEY